MPSSTLRVNIAALSGGAGILPPKERPGMLWASIRRQDARATLLASINMETQVSKPTREALRGGGKDKKIPEFILRASAAKHLLHWGLLFPGKDGRPPGTRPDRTRPGRHGREGAAGS